MQRPEHIAKRRNRCDFQSVFSALFQFYFNFLSEETAARFPAVYKYFDSGIISLHFQFRTLFLTEHRRGKLHLAREIRKTVFLQIVHALGRGGRHQGTFSVYGEIPAQIYVFKLGIIPKAVSHALRRLGRIQGPENMGPFVKIQLVDIFVCSLSYRRGNIRLLKHKVVGALGKIQRPTVEGRREILSLFAAERQLLASVLNRKRIFDVEFSFVFRAQKPVKYFRKRLFLCVSYTVEADLYHIQSEIVVRRARKTKFRR